MDRNKKRLKITKKWLKEVYYEKSNLSSLGW